ncbi:hypothetical protein PR202_ga17192 [Eleusine coracana subsp. coracana]|uniref:Uncharacterized protein n=1 Tax=Eleusine coracana subsp. coracana TaxID=191504 RepID=A0AAV5CNK0_ELECO|nr:hypothetical protein PR202_ga17192 [Eleusine coracana subsp. coracana]
MAKTSQYQAKNSQDSCLAVLGERGERRGSKLMGEKQATGEYGRWREELHVGVVGCCCAVRPQRRVMLACSATTTCIARCRHRRVRLLPPPWLPAVLLTLAGRLPSAAAAAALCVSVPGVGRCGVVARVGDLGIDGLGQY